MALLQADSAEQRVAVGTQHAKQLKSFIRLQIWDPGRGGGRYNQYGAEPPLQRELAQG